MAGCRNPEVPLKAETPQDCDRLFSECMGRGDIDALLTRYEPGAGVAREDGTAVPRAGNGVEILRRQGDGSWRYVLDDAHVSVPLP